MSAPRSDARPPITLTVAAGYAQVAATFTAHLSKHMHLDGQPFTVVGPAAGADPDSDTFGPTYRIRFEDGTEIDAWPEEVEEPANLVSDAELFAIPRMRA